MSKATITARTYALATYGTRQPVTLPQVPMHSMQ